MKKRKFLLLFLFLFTFLTGCEQFVSINDTSNTSNNNNQNDEEEKPSQNKDDLNELYSSRYVSNNEVNVVSGQVNIEVAKAFFDNGQLKLELWVTNGLNEILSEIQNISVRINSNSIVLNETYPKVVETIDVNQKKKIQISFDVNKLRNKDFTLNKVSIQASIGNYQSIANEYVSSNPLTTYNAVSVSAKRIYFDNNNQLVADLYIHNGTSKTVNGITNLKLSLKDSSGNLLSTKIIDKVDELISPNETKTYTVRLTCDQSASINHATITTLFDVESDVTGPSIHVLNNLSSLTLEIMSVENGKVRLKGPDGNVLLVDSNDMDQVIERFVSIEDESTIASSKFNYLDTIDLSKETSLQVFIQATDQYNNSSEKSLTFKLLDKALPNYKKKTDVLLINQYQSIKPEDVVASCTDIGSHDACITTVSAVDHNLESSQEVTVTVKDKKGNATSFKQAVIIRQASFNKNEMIIYESSDMNAKYYTLGSIGDDTYIFSRKQVNKSTSRLTYMNIDLSSDQKTLDFNNDGMFFYYKIAYVTDHSGKKNTILVVQYELKEKNYLSFYNLSKDEKTPFLTVGDTELNKYSKLNFRINQMFTHDHVLLISAKHSLDFSYIITYDLRKVVSNPSTNKKPTYYYDFKVEGYEKEDTEIYQITQANNTISFHVLYGDPYKKHWYAMEENYAGYMDYFEYQIQTDGSIKQTKRVKRLETKIDNYVPAVFDADYYVYNVFYLYDNLKQTYIAEVKDLKDNKHKYLVFNTDGDKPEICRNSDYKQVCELEFFSPNSLLKIDSKYYAFVYHDFLYRSLDISKDHLERQDYQTDVPAYKMGFVFDFTYVPSGSKIHNMYFLNSKLYIEYTRNNKYYLKYVKV
jgi:SLAP domain-containing protein